MGIALDCVPVLFLSSVTCRRLPLIRSSSCALPASIAQGAASIGMARLSAEYGADMPLDDILLRLSASCHFASDRTGKPGCHGVYLPDLEHPTRDPDLPPQWPRKGRQRLRVIPGGRPTKKRVCILMVYRKGEMTKGDIDRRWPHQVVLRAEHLGAANT